MKVLAIIPTYNEADVLPAVLTHLHAQGVDTYVIDNWSTDGTGPLIKSIGRCIRTPAPHLYYELFPNNSVHIYQWERILRRVEEVALKFSDQYDWMMLHDADEIRRWSDGPYEKSLTLSQAIEETDDGGWNVIDFQVLTFPPIDNEFQPGNNPEEYFTRYRLDSGYERVSQEKCWKVYPGVGVDLASTGGHKVRYAGQVLPGGMLIPFGDVRRVCPHKFILKHYPIRSQSHGERKVFEERQKRWHLGERNNNWHTQYDGIKSGHNFLADPKGLIEYE